MYKAGGFPNMSESSNFNSAIKVRCLVKRTYFTDSKSFKYICKGVNEFPKNEMLFFKNINMKPEILDSSKNILNVRGVKYVYISF